MPGRSMAGRESLKLVMSVRFAPRQPNLLCIESSRSGEGYGYFSFKENTVTDCSLLRVSEKRSAVSREVFVRAK